MMIELLLIAVALVAIAASAVFSGTETGFYSLNRLRLLRRAENPGDRRARVLQRLMADPQSLLATVLLGNNLANYIATLACNLVVTRYVSEGFRAIVTTLVLSPLLFVFGEVTPKNVFRRNADRFCYRLARPLEVFRWALWPVVRILCSVGALATRFLGHGREEPSAVFSRRGLRMLFLESGHSGILSEVQSRLAGTIVAGLRARVEEIMTRLDARPAVDEETPLGELLDTLDASLPDHVALFRRRPRNVVGFVDIDALLYDESLDRGAPLETFAREIPIVPSHWPVDQAMLLLRARRSPIAAVVDEEDEAVGLVSLRDLSRVALAPVIGSQ